VGLCPICPFHEAWQHHPEPQTANREPRTANREPRTANPIEIETTCCPGESTKQNAAQANQQNKMLSMRINKTIIENQNQRPIKRNKKKTSECTRQGSV
jgi:hypothetical protein